MYLKVKILLVGCVLAMMLVAGCRGQRSAKPPIHLIPNMDNQPKYRAFGANPFYPDQRAMRPLLEGTVPRGFLQADDGYYKGMLVDSQFVDNPREITMELLLRGQERFNIFCSVCHGLAGDGQGIVIKRGFTPSTDYTDERILNFRDGEIFNTITHGIRTMPSMKTQIPVDDRWAIVAYVRALQRSRTATIEDVPESERGTLLQESGDAK